MEILEQIEQKLKTYNWFLNMLNDKNFDKEMIAEVVSGVIELWTRQLEQEYLTKKLEEESISHDYEIAIDYAEREEED